MAGLQVLETKRFEVTFESVQRGFLSERKGKVTQCRWTENRKGAGTKSGESGARNLEAESIRSRAEYVRVCKVEDSHGDKMDQCP